MAGVQMTPAALRLMVIERTRLTAFRTSPLQPIFMSEVDMHLSGLQLQFDAFHAPRFSNSQNLGIQISILHLPIIRFSPLQCRMSHLITILFYCRRNIWHCESNGKPDMIRRSR